MSLLVKIITNIAHFLLLAIAGVGIYSAFYNQTSVSLNDPIYSNPHDTPHIRCYNNLSPICHDHNTEHFNQKEYYKTLTYDNTKNNIFFMNIDNLMSECLQLNDKNIIKHHMLALKYEKLIRSGQWLSEFSAMILGDVMSELQRISLDPTRVNNTEYDFDVYDFHYNRINMLYNQAIDYKEKIAMIKKRNISNFLKDIISAIDILLNECLTDIEQFLNYQDAIDIHGSNSGYNYIIEDYSNKASTPFIISKNSKNLLYSENIDARGKYILLFYNCIVSFVLKDIKLEDSNITSEMHKMYRTSLILNNKHKIDQLSNINFWLTDIKQYKTNNSTILYKRYKRKNHSEILADVIERCLKILIESELSPEVVDRHVKRILRALKNKIAHNVIFTLNFNAITKKTFYDVRMAYLIAHGDKLSTIWGEGINIFCYFKHIA